MRYEETSKLIPDMTIIVRKFQHVYHTLQRSAASFDKEMALIQSDTFSHKQSYFTINLLHYWTIKVSDTSASAWFFNLPLDHSPANSKTCDHVSKFPLTN